MENLELFPKSVLVKLISLLDNINLRDCVLVCKKWNDALYPFLKEKFIPAQFEDKLGKQFIMNNEPIEYQDKILSALKRTFPLSQTSLLEIVKIVHPISKAQNYKIAIDGKYYLLKIFYDLNRSDKFPINRKEIQLLNYFNELRISPIIHYLDLQTGVTISNFLEPYEAKKKNLKKEILLNLASKLRRLHGASIPFSYRNTIQQSSGLYIKRAQSMHKTSRNDSAPAFYKKALEYYSELETLVIAQCPIHADLTLDSIVCDKTQVFLINWENVGIGDPLFDLATIVIHFQLDFEQEKTFLDGYFKVIPGEHTKARYYIAKLLVLLKYSITLFDNLEQLEKIDVEIDIDSIIPISKLYNEVSKSELDTMRNKFYLALSAFKEVMESLSSQEFIAAKKLIQKGIKHKSLLTVDALRDRYFPVSEKLPDVVIDKIFRYVLNDYETAKFSSYLSKSWRQKVLEQYELACVHGDFTLIGLTEVDELYRDQIANTLKQAFKNASGNIYRIEPLPGGHSDRAKVFKISSAHHEYVLRFILPHVEKRMVLQQFAAMEFFGRYGISPFVQHANSSTNCIVINFVKKQENWFKEVSSLELMAIAECILSMSMFKNSILFKSALGMSKKLLNLGEHLITFKSQHPEFQCLIDSGDALNVMNKSFLTFYSNDICHGDLHPPNILLDSKSKPYIIDFEDMFKNSGLFDIATIVIFNNIDLFTERLLLMVYFGKDLSQENMKEYFLNKTYAFLYFSMLFAIPTPFETFRTMSKKVDHVNKFSNDSDFQLNYTDEGYLRLAIMLAKEGLYRFNSSEYQQAFEYLLGKNSKQHTNLPKI